MVMKRGIPKLEKIRRQIILPPWARQIKVRQTDTYLVVFGKRWWFHPLKRDPYGDLQLTRQTDRQQWAKGVYAAQIVACSLTY